MTIRTTAERAEVLALLDYCTRRGEREDLARLRALLRVPGRDGLYWTATARAATIGVALASWRKLDTRRRARERRAWLATLDREVRP